MCIHILSNLVLNYTNIRINASYFNRMETLQKGFSQLIFQVQSCLSPQREFVVSSLMSILLDFSLVIYSMFL